MKKFQETLKMMKKKLRKFRIKTLKKSLKLD